ncbi:MAG: hypothetical protein U0527_00825 [Candidatus Eisenbacteria bacterium]
MQSHPTHDEILGLCQAQIVGAAPKPEVVTHVERCDRCQSDSREISTVLQALRSPTLIDVPDAWYATALRTLERLEAEHRPASLADRVKSGIGQARERVRQFIQEVEAGLVLDSHAGALMPGIRGNATAAPRQLLFESPLGQILLQVDTTGKRHDVRGQFLPASGEIGDDALATLTLDGKTFETKISATGEFLLTQLPSGLARLRVEAAGCAITLAPMHLPPGAEI